CGFTHENNRPTSDGQDVFECLKCDYGKFEAKASRVQRGEDVNRWRFVCVAR
ncbi:hypothetical protein GJ633_00005, partial [Halorubrum sp. CBA1125]|nr:hypothetical protein [Halorubrum sp. CBA1125]